MFTYNIPSNQPLPETLRPVLPINFFLFAKIEAGVKPEMRNAKIVKSTFHNTEVHKIGAFYKSISNIL